MNTKKKILYIITQSEFGGAQRYLFELITHLDPQKYDITIATGPGGDFLDRLKAKNYRIYRLKHLTRPINPIKDLKAYFELKNLIYTIKPDILQLHSTKAGVLGSLAWKKYKEKNDKCQMINDKCIYRIGGWAFLENIPSWKKWLYIKAEKYTSKYKDKIIVNCEAHRQLAINLNIAPPEKIITIYNGLDLEKLNFLSREQTRQKLITNNQTKNPDQESELSVTDSKKPVPIVEKHHSFLPNGSYHKYNNSSSFVKCNCGQLYKDNLKQPVSAGRESNPHHPFGKNGILPIKLPAHKQTASSLYHNKYIVGTVANFYKNKGLKYLIQAMSNVRCQMSDVRCIIIGDGNERSDLEKLISNLNLKDKIVLTGKMKNAWKYLRAFDIFCLPSIKEGQPWSVLEAMAAEIPIIATNIAAIPEMLENNKSGLLIEPKNPQAIREKIEYLIKNPEIAQKLGQNARKIIKQKFTIQKMIQETEKLYNK